MGPKWVLNTRATMRKTERAQRVFLEKVEKFSKAMQDMEILFRRTIETYVHLIQMTLLTKLLPSLLVYTLRKARFISKSL